MGYIFAAHDEVIWDPGMITSRLFTAMLEHVAQEESFADIPTGFSAMASDYYNIDPEQFAVFVRAVLRSAIVDNRYLKDLMRGFLVTCLVLLDRAGVVMEPLNESQQDLFDARARLSGSM